MQPYIFKENIDNNMRRNPRMILLQKMRTKPESRQDVRGEYTNYNTKELFMQYEKFTTMSREALTAALRLAKEQILKSDRVTSYLDFYHETRSLETSSDKSEPMKVKFNVNSKQYFKDSHLHQVVQALVNPERWNKLSPPHTLSPENLEIVTSPMKFYYSPSAKYARIHNRC